MCSSGFAAAKEGMPQHRAPHAEGSDSQRTPSSWHHCCDDLIILEQVLREQSGDLAEGYVRSLRAREACASVGLASNPKKAIEREKCARFWGIELMGERGW